MAVKSLITGGGNGLIAWVRQRLDPRPRLCVDAIIDTAFQQPVPVTFGVASRSPSMISLYYSQSIGAIVANSYRRVITYEVPEGYYGFLIRYTSYQSEAANSRVVTEINMGTLNIVTNVFVGGAPQNAYVPPQWTGLPQLEITETIGAASDVIVTISYTNEHGISARTATCSITKNSIAGGRCSPVLQAGDLGIQSVENMSVAPTSSSGAVKLLGFIQLGYHEDAGTSSYETLYAPGATAFEAGSIIGMEFQGGIVAKARRFDLLIQLSEEIVQ